MEKRWHLMAAAGSAVLYAAALLLPTAAPFNPEFSDTTYPGYVAFETCWRILLAWESWEFEWWLLSGAWFANPAIWLATTFVALRRWRDGAIAGGCGLLLSLMVLPMYGAIIVGLPGFWAWIGSSGFLLAVTVVW